MAITKPFNLKKWISENRNLLQPPVGAHQIYTENEDYIVIVVGGPNGRKDYHWEDGEELFYQLEGDIHVNIINENGEKERIDIREGEMFLLPAHIPHSPQRPAGTVGLVIERKRREGEYDKLMWYCENCNNSLHEASFALKNLGAQVKGAIMEYNDNEKARTCDNCGTVMGRV